jgi:hypothetical protein
MKNKLYDMIFAYDLLKNTNDSSLGTMYQMCNWSVAMSIEYAEKLDMT